MTRAELEKSLAQTARDNLQAGAGVIMALFLERGKSPEEVEIALLGLIGILEDIENHVKDFLDLVNMSLEERSGEVYRCQLFVPVIGDIQERLHRDPASQRILKGDLGAVHELSQPLMQDAECYLYQEIVFYALVCGLRKYNKTWKPGHGDRFALVFQDDAV